MLETVAGFFNTVFSAIIGFLPGSPFRALVSSFSNIPYLEELNWFVPISEIIAVMQAWLAVVAIYYTYSAIMRFIRLI